MIKTDGVMRVILAYYSYAAVGSNYKPKKSIGYRAWIRYSTVIKKPREEYCLPETP